MELILATSNPGKLLEMREMLTGYPVMLKTPDDLGGVLDVEEDGETFAENALKKARAYVEWYDLPALADDGGLEVDALDGAPGVHSRRWLGDVPETDLVSGLLRRMRSVPENDRGAQFRGAVALALPDGRYWITEGILRGSIANVAVHTVFPGLPYRQIFMISGFHKVWAELTPVEAALVKNHRIQALEKLVVQLSDIFSVFT